jgi:hypothetical protein
LLSSFYYHFFVITSRAFDNRIGLFHPIAEGSTTQRICPKQFMINNKRTRAGSEKQYGPRLVGEILHDYLENSNEPFARAYREHKAEAEAEGDDDQLFVDIHPNTESCVDIKLMTRQPGRMPLGKYLPGMLTRDGEDHFLFVESGDRKRVVAHRNPRIYRGRYINVVRRADGSLVLTFNRPVLTEEFSFRDFCLAAVQELLSIIGLIDEEAFAE